MALQNGVQVFAAKPSKYGSAEGQKKFTSTPRNENVLRAFKNPPKAIDSSPIVLKSAKEKSAQEPAKAGASQSQSTKPDVKNFFKFRKTPSQEYSMFEDKQHEIASNDVHIPAARNGPNRPPLQPINRGSSQEQRQKDSVRTRTHKTNSRTRPESDDEIEVIDQVAGDKPTSSESKKRPKKSHKANLVPPRNGNKSPASTSNGQEPEDVSRVTEERSTRNDGQRKLQPKFLEHLANNSRYISTKTDEERAEEAERARELALKCKPRKRGGDSLFDTIRKGAKLNVKKKSSS